MSRILVLAGGLLTSTAGHAVCAQHPTSLAAMHDCYRALLVTAPAANDARFRQQLDGLLRHETEFRRRDLILVPILGDDTALSDPMLPTARLSKAENDSLRARFHLGSGFEAVLIGKDGGEKLRSQQPLSAEKLFAIIDAMPMRKREMREQTR